LPRGKEALQFQRVARRDVAHGCIRQRALKNTENIDAAKVGQGGGTSPDEPFARVAERDAVINAERQRRESKSAPVKGRDSVKAASNAWSSSVY
jgi:hypothetical protein